MRRIDESGMIADKRGLETEFLSKTRFLRAFPNKLLSLTLIIVLIIALWTPLSLTAVEAGQPQTAHQICDPQSQQASGANYLICMPLFGWNQKVILYAHEYIAPNEPLRELSADTRTMELAAGVTLNDYAFAATSYRQNGLAVQEAIEDIIDLAAIFEQQKGTPDKNYILGVSQGGLISALALERHPELFDGGWALCGTYGDFRDYSDYVANGRVLFDYFFPGVMEGSVVQVPTSMMDSWGNYYVNNIKPVLTDSANAHLVDQLLATAGIAFNADDERSKAAAIETVLWYNAVATNDGIEKLGGQPFDNMNTVYSGSDDDTKLNEEVGRFAADAAALTELGRYQTSGVLRRPLVTMHTTRDPVVPYNQLERYQEKIDQAGASAYYHHIDSSHYGHCEFDNNEIFQALAHLETLVTAVPAAPLSSTERFNIFLPIVIQKN